MPISACHFLEPIDRKSYTYLEERNFGGPALSLLRPTGAGETATERDGDLFISCRLASSLSMLHRLRDIRPSKTNIESSLYAYHCS